MNFEPFPKARFVADQCPEFRSQCVRQRIGKGGEQHPSVWIRSSKEDSTMHRNKRLARACRTRRARWTVIIALNQSALRWMQEHCPFVPGVIQGAFQFLDVGHHAEAALCVRVLERV